jgi:hypothetical protein
MNLAEAPLGLLLARVLGEAHEPLTLRELAHAVRETKAPTSAIHDTLGAMVAGGFVQVIDGRYATAGLDFPSSPRHVHPTKPIVIAREGRGYSIHVSGVPLVDDPAGGAGFTRQPAGIKKKRPHYAPPSSRVHVFTKLDEAKHAAHQIGRYMMQLGDMVFSYTELPPWSRW